MLVGHALAGNFANVPLFLFGELVVFAALDWELGIGVNFPDTLIACVGFQLDPLQRPHARSLEQREIVGLSVGDGSADNTARCFVYHDLRL